MTIPFQKEDVLSGVKKSLDGKPAGLNAAVFIASAMLFNEQDRNGEDYMAHCIRVSFNNTLSPTKQIVGMLHDVVEDTDVTLSDLRDVGFSEKIVDAVDGMTKRKGEQFFDFVERCSLNKISRDKKITDLRDNSSIFRADHLLTEKELNKTQAYIVAHNYLVAIKKEKIEAGSSIVEFMQSRPKLYSESLIQDFSSRPVPTT